MRISKPQLLLLIRETLTRVPTKTISVGDSECKVLVPQNDLQKSVGLMNRKHLPDGEGMLFMYDSPQTLSFWMKDTHVPLSIAFIDGDGRIVAIKDMQPHDHGSTTSPPGCVGALEVPQGWFQRQGIGLGDHVYT